MNSSMQPRRRRILGSGLGLGLAGLVPLAALLVRAVENPEVADTLVHTGRALDGWDHKSAPPDAAASK